MGRGAVCVEWVTSGATSDQYSLTERQHFHGTEETYVSTQVASTPHPLCLLCSLSEGLPLGSPSAPPARQLGQRKQFGYDYEDYLQIPSLWWVHMSRAAGPSHWALPYMADIVTSHRWRALT